ncbi:hypothetical protein HO173_012251 [Letharia columbiana]|uniref:BTB domain-containing protein n=1 Tax=Letharia columbiana TaxID=112416 RepID=A0A8H6FGR1_9LECA|nr:uncharacterized protein HO173_012251 [Letharia columbiana]KAF6227511.1 hypothetical protein HO173_012251 [Letharia columbiana]
MPPPAPPLSRQTTMSGGGIEPSHPKPKGQKRKTMAATDSENSEPRKKRIKTETASMMEQEMLRPTGTAVDSIYDAIVTVKVGGLAQKVGIHRGLLRRASRFFREQLTVDATMEDGVSAQVVFLLEEDVHVFRRFKDWLYSGRIISEAETNKDLTWSDLIAIYEFAERREVPQLQNTCVDTVIRKRREGGLFPGQGDVNTLWKASGQVFRRRRLLLDQFATSCNLKNAIAHNGGYHPKFPRVVDSLYDNTRTEARHPKNTMNQKKAPTQAVHVVIAELADVIRTVYSDC